MKVIVASEANVAPNMVRGAFQQAKAQGVEVVGVHAVGDMAGAITDEAVVLVDWEGDDAVCASYVAAAKSKLEFVPVLLLCAKSRAGTTFSGMKAGALGIVNKPIDAEELVRAVAAAAKKGGAKKTSVNVEFINPFIEATKNVFTTMCQMSVERKRLFLKDDHKMLGDISGVMGLTGAATGSVVISLPGKLACFVVGKMLGEAPKPTLDPDVCDAVGELINMIAGQAKAMLVKTKYHFTISLPSVVSGTGHEITHRKGTPNIVVLFEVDQQEFAIQVCLAPTEGADAS